MEKAPSGKKVGKTILKTVLWITGIWAAVLLIVQIVLSPAFLTKILNDFSDNYIDGDLRFGRAGVSVFRHFPNISLTLSDVSLTYPGEKFSEYETGEGEHRLLAAGKGESVDTLASFSKLSVSLNAAALLTGKINIPHVHLTGPRIFAKNYAEEAANWNIFKSSGEGQDEADDEGASAGLPDISAGKIIIDGHPLIVYCSRPDTLGAAVRFDKLSVTKHRKHYGLDLHARTGVAMPSVGRVMIPIDITSHVSFPKDTVPAVSIRRFNARIAGVPVKAEADIRYCTDSVSLKLAAAIDRCSVSDVLGYCGENIWEGASEIKTDAVVDLRINADGWYNFDGSRLPAFDASLYIPESNLRHDGLGFDSTIEADIEADGRNPESIAMTVKSLHIDSEGLCLHLSGTADDILGNDPLFTVSGDLKVSLDTLAAFLDPEHGIQASGGLEADLDGKIRMSQMDMYKFADADLKGSVKSSRLDLSSEKDTLRLHLDSLDAVFATTAIPKAANLPEGRRAIVFSATLDSLRAGYKHAFAVKGSDWSLKAQNDAAILDPKDSSAYYPLGGRLELGSLSLMGSDSMRVNLHNSSSTFRIMPSPADRSLPMMTLKSDNGSLRMSAAGNRLSARNFNLNITATKNPSASSPKRRDIRKYADSLAKQHSDIPRDSLYEHIRKTRGTESIPEWLSEADFRKSDIDFRIDESIAKYYKEWNFDGVMSIKRASVMTPMFPLRTSISNFDGKIDNNSVDIKSFKIKSGTSDLSATGKLTGLRRALLANGTVNLNVRMESGRLNVNELLGAWAAGKDVNAESLVSSTDGMSDDEYEKMFITDTLINAVPETALLVIPANVNAEISMEAANVTYGRFELDKASAEISMRERCVLLKNTVASTNLGDIAFEGFYSTRTKKDIKTGFNMNLSNVTAEKVIEMMPSVDSLIPMIKSFKGLLDCEVAATAQIDTGMNIIMPSLNGVIRIGGKDLGLKETEDLYKILRLLRFKNIHSINIDKMSVEGIISDNTLEIFPFVMKVDRYTLAMSGLQNMDQTFKYHVSVIKSPLLIRFGVDLWGNFDDFKFKIGKAKYKNKRVPVFSAVVDETRLNLSQAIRNIFSKGVDEAIRENAQMTAINEHKRNIGYKNQAVTEIEELSAAETRKLESGEERDEDAGDDDEDDESGEDKTDADNLKEN